MKLLDNNNKFEILYKKHKKGFDIFVVKFKEHLDSNKKAREILIRHINGEKISEAEQEFFRLQIIDIIKSIGIGIPTLILPFGLALFGFAVFLCKKYNIDILPSYLKD